MHRVDATTGERECGGRRGDEVLARGERAGDDDEGVSRSEEEIRRAIARQVVRSMTSMVPPWSPLTVMSAGVVARR
jgi:hypothetical protein